MCFNDRSIDGILSMILRLGAMVGKTREAEKYIRHLQRNLSAITKRAAKLKRRPRVYFEEWYDPIITGICWVSEIIELCGGVDIYAENRAFCRMQNASHHQSHGNYTTSTGYHAGLLVR